MYLPCVYSMVEIRIKIKNRLHCIFLTTTGEKSYGLKGVFIKNGKGIGLRRKTIAFDRY